MRQPNLAEHYWQLESAEARHAAYPEEFSIPTRAERENLRRGQAAKLLFELEGEASGATVDRIVERIWVLVVERVGDRYIGVLDNQPLALEPAPNVYLVEGAEIPFGPEHVIDIAEPPPEWISERLGRPPTR